MNKIKRSVVNASIVLAMGCAIPSVYARDVIQIAGSSTVLPFASIVAEEFGQAFPSYKTPVVASGGSGAGIRQFCQGVGENTIDIANASRPMSKDELDSCHKNGVNKIVEVEFGYDGIVFASSTEKQHMDLKTWQIFDALSAKVIKNGKLVDNPYKTWKEIDPSLPDQEITLAIPASNHGTREVFDEKVMQSGCDHFPELKSLSKEEKEKACHTTRKDGRAIEISGDYTETLARIQAQKNIVGVFGLSFYEQNRDTIQVASVNGVVPTAQSVAEKKYPVSRPLYFYVKGEHVATVPGLAQYTEYFLSDAIAGPTGPLVQNGLIPLPDGVRHKIADKVKSELK